MPLHTTKDPARIAELITPLLEADPIRTTILATALRMIQVGGTEGWCAHPDGEPQVVATRGRPGSPIALTEGWADGADLAEALVRLGEVDTIGGPVAEVTTLSTELAARGWQEKSRIRERLYFLDALVDPSTVSGSARLAAEDDVELLALWYADYMVEVFDGVPDVDSARTSTRQALEIARLWVWVDAGAVRSFALARTPLFGAGRIGPVYTPPEFRGHGYGSAATAAASRDVLDAGGTPVLYTDLGNPTSNSIYQRLGYQPVEDRLHVEFG